MTLDITTVTKKRAMRILIASTAVTRCLRSRCRWPRRPSFSDVLLLRLRYSLTVVAIVVILSVVDVISVVDPGRRLKEGR